MAIFEFINIDPRESFHADMHAIKFTDRLSGFRSIVENKLYTLLSYLYDTAIHKTWLIITLVLVSFHSRIAFNFQDSRVISSVCCTDDKVDFSTEVDLFNFNARVIIK